MYTPETTRERKILRNEINHKFVDVNPINIFKNLQSELHPVVTFSCLQPFCQSAEIPYENLKEIFAPYGVNEPYLSQQQFVDFFNDDFPDYTKPAMSRACLVSNRDLFSRSSCIFSEINLGLQ